jgi:hypothetical protein
MCAAFIVANSNAMSVWSAKIQDVQDSVLDNGFDIYFVRRTVLGALLYSYPVDTKGGLTANLGSGIASRISMCYGSEQE